MADSMAMNGVAAGGASASAEPLPTSPPPPTLDCDSDELEALEDMAEAESAADDEIDGIVDAAAAIYPPERVEQLLDELKQCGLVAFMLAHVVGQSATRVKALLVALGVLLPRAMRDDNDVPLPVLVEILKTALVRHLRIRDKLPQYNTVDDAVQLLQNAQRIVVLGGAGISTSCGIPDFRSEDGIYAQLQRTNKYPELTDPTDMFHKDFFLHDPSCFFSFARDIFPSNFTPSPSHRFIKLLEDRGQLLRHYTQNIDTLEDAAGISRVLHCHGSFSGAKCTEPTCGYEVPGSAIKSDIMAQRVPQCPQCQEREAMQRTTKLAKHKAHLRKKNGRGKGGDDGSDDEEGQDRLPGLSVMKPCITFFGEKLSDEFDRCLVADREEVDLLIIMGTTLKVAPVSEIVAHFPHNTPVLLINRTPVLHFNLDVQMLGNADEIVAHLSRRLGWSLPLPDPQRIVVGKESAAQEMGKGIVDEEAAAGKDKRQSGAGEDIVPERLGESHFWLFPGAEAEELIQMMRDAEETSSGGGRDADSADGEDLGIAVPDLDAAALPSIETSGSRKRSLERTIASPHGTKNDEGDRAANGAHDATLATSKRSRLQEAGQPKLAD